MKKRANKKISAAELPKYTALGFLFGVAMAVIFMILIIISAVNRGEAGVGIGFVGVLVMIVSGFGLSMAIKGVKEDENMYYTIPVISVGLNGIIFITTFILYIVGLFI